MLTSPSLLGKKGFCWSFSKAVVRHLRQLCWTDEGYSGVMYIEPGRQPVFSEFFLNWPCNPTPGVAWSIQFLRMMFSRWSVAFSSDPWAQTSETELFSKPRTRSHSYIILEWGRRLFFTSEDNCPSYCSTRPLGWKLWSLSDRPVTALWNLAIPRSLPVNWAPVWVGAVWVLLLRKLAWQYTVFCRGIWLRNVSNWFSWSLQDLLMESICQFCAPFPPTSLPNKKVQ